MVLLQMSKTDDKIFTEDAQFCIPELRRWVWSLEASPKLIATVSCRVNNNLLIFYHKTKKFFVPMKSNLL
ncbi:hypothetical protein B9Z55_023316 [Caenorhabditis nigoni]|nr:hypothetical protein B9Z55_023316 [Caenorhabditis nigoni]